MKLLEDRILKDGKIYPGDILKVDSFVNHMIDIPFMCKLADEFYRLFNNLGINKILTIEASGIGISALTAEKFGCPLVFAKKSKTTNISNNCYTADVYSYTHNTVNHILVCKDYLSPDDKVLIIDDFLATGAAFEGLVSICEQAGAEIIGLGSVIEKTYQNGGNKLRERFRVESLAKVSAMTDNSVTFE